MKMKPAYLNLLTEVLTRNTDGEILNFCEDLIEGLKIRTNIIKEGAQNEKEVMKKSVINTKVKTKSGTKLPVGKDAPKPKTNKPKGK